MPYHGKKWQRTFISNNEKEAPGFKAGRDRLTLLFCANAVEFMIRAALNYEAANMEPWREKINTSRDENTFCTGSISALSLKSGSNLPTRGSLLKFFWYWTMSLATQNPVSSTMKESKWSTCPQHNICNSAPGAGGHRTFKAHSTWYSTERTVSAMKRT